MSAHASSVRTRPWVDDRRINSGRSTRVTVESTKRTDPTRRTLSTRAKAPFPMGWMTSKSSNPIALVCLLAPLGPTRGGRCCLSYTGRAGRAGGGRGQRPRPPQGRPVPV